MHLSFHGCRGRAVHDLPPADGAPAHQCVLPSRALSCCRRAPTVRHRRIPRREHSHALPGFKLAHAAPLLRERQCLFGGGTAIALRHGEYRESVDVDFLVSELEHYRELRSELTCVAGLRAILRAEAQPFEQTSELRADQSQ